MNKVVLVGRLARDPELRYAAGSGTLPLTVRAIKPICIRYGSYTSSTVSASSPIVVAIVSIPTGLP